MLSQARAVTRLYSAWDATISQDRCLPVCVHDIVAGSPRKRFHGYGMMAHVTDTSRAAFHPAAAATDTVTTMKPRGRFTLDRVTGKRNVNHDLSMSVVAELPSLHRYVSFACESERTHVRRLSTPTEIASA